MKIGIVTFHCSNNHGAVLQAIALTEILNELGHDARIIDYRPSYKTEAYKPFGITRRYPSIKHFLYHVCSTPWRYTTDKEFGRFNSINMKTWGRVYYTSKEMIDNPPAIDAAITGSDQVWNPETLGAVDEVYFLGFGPENLKRISYAASFGTSNVDKVFWHEMSNYIRNLDAVSVREIEGRELVKDMTGLDVTHVLDPVFLLDRSKWNEFSDSTFEIDEPYLLLYARQRSELLSDVAYKISKENKLKIVNISNIMIGLRRYDKNMFSLGPGHFLKLIRDSSVVCTNSFHGTAFSVVYGKPFVVTPHRTRNTRIDSILQTLGLADRLITNKHQIDNTPSSDLIHWDLGAVRHRLDREREESINFLVHALDDSGKKDDMA